MEMLVCSEGLEAASSASYLHFVDLGTGQTLFSFKTNSVSHKTLSIINNEYLLHAVSNKAILQAFALTRTGHQPKKVVTPGVVKVLCSSIDGTLLAAGIGEKILLWDAQGGDLLCILSKHYQDVTCLKITSDSGLLVSAGADGLVMAWNISKLIQTDTTGCTDEPTSSFLAHTLPVTGLACSFSSINNPRIYSSSGDRTIKIHDPLIGQTVLSVVFETGITSLVVDNAETVLCAGGMNGSIYRLDLISICKHKKEDIEVEITSKDFSECSNLFKGHVNPIMTLAFSLDCSLLVSSAKNEGLFLWDVYSGQCIKTIKCSNFSNGGTIGNTAIIPTPICLTTSSAKPTVNFPKLAHTTKIVGQLSEKPRINICHSSHDKQSTSCLDKYLSCAHNNCAESLNKGSAIAEEINLLRQENRRLHEFTMRKILSNAK